MSLMDFLLSSDVGKQSPVWEKKMIVKCCLSVVFLFLVTTALFAAEERYLCVAEKVTGFSYEKGLKSWVATNFSINEHKYIISRPNSDKKKLEVRIVGTSVPICWDKDGFNEYDYANFYCIAERIFKVKKNTGRFMTIYPQGYIHGDEVGETPYIVIGKCSPF